jgi:hypothetical protein
VTFTDAAYGTNRTCLLIIAYGKLLKFWLRSNKTSVIIGGDTLFSLPTVLRFMPRPTATFILGFQLVSGVYRLAWMERWVCNVTKKFFDLQVLFSRDLYGIIERNYYIHFRHYHVWARDEAGVVSLNLAYGLFGLLRSGPTFRQLAWQLYSYILSRAGPGIVWSAN